METELEKACRYYLRQKEKVERATASSRQRLLALTIPETNGWQAIELRDPTSLHKVVASVKGELVCAHGGDARFSIGRWTLAKHGANAWPPLSSCFVAYKLPEQALSERFPRDSKRRAAPKVLIEVTASGKAYFNPQTSTWALSRVRPIRLLPDIIRAPISEATGVPDGAPTEHPSPERNRTPIAWVAHLDAKANPWVP